MPTNNAYCRTHNLEGLRACGLNVVTSLDKYLEARKHINSPSYLEGIRIEQKKKLEITNLKYYKFCGVNRV